jgi:hypothetical protein
VVGGLILAGLGAYALALAALNRRRATLARTITAENHGFYDQGLLRAIEQHREPVYERTAKMFVIIGGLLMSAGVLSMALGAF